MVGYHMLCLSLWAIGACCSQSQEYLFRLLSSDSILDRDELVAALLEVVRKAVGAWISCSDAGRACFNYAGGDLNIGDLGSYLDDVDLVRCFRDCGIFGFSIVEPFASSCWVFDTALVSGDV
jgi:hypothetical protein